MLDNSDSDPVPSPAPTREGSHISMRMDFDQPDAAAMSPIKITLIVLGALAVIAVLVAVIFRPKPPADGNITKVLAVDQDGNVLVAVQAKFYNQLDSPVSIQGIGSELEAADGKKYTDTAAPASDVGRYLQGYPALSEGQIEPLKRDTKIAPHSVREGIAIFAYPVKKADFDARKSLSMSIRFYERPAALILR